MTQKETIAQLEKERDEAVASSDRWRRLSSVWRGRAQDLADELVNLRGRAQDLADELVNLRARALEAEGEGDVRE